MLAQEIALEKICASLKRDPHIQAIFLKGSMGRNEHDEHSDIDLYCLVDQDHIEEFLLKRVEHLAAHRPLIFQDDIFIIAPQLIAVFDDFLHIDLFTVTPESFPEKDYFRVLYDPKGMLEQFEGTQTLELKEAEFQDAVIDVAWFLFQYKKASARGNDIWAARMLTNVMDHLARVLLHKYAPNRAQLGLKTIEQSLPDPLYAEVKAIFGNITPTSHPAAAQSISRLLATELKWVLSNATQFLHIEPLLCEMIEFHSGEPKKESGMKNHK